MHPLSLFPINCIHCVCVTQNRFHLFCRKEWGFFATAENDTTTTSRYPVHEPVSHGVGLVSEYCVGLLYSV
jgi:hypothetical protein